MAKKDTAKTTWTPEQDALLRRTLEDAQGTASWGTIAATAFPGGEHDKLDCTEVSLLQLSLHAPAARQGRGALEAQADPGARALASQRWKVLGKPRPLRGPWTKEEDAKLQALVDQHGSEKWVSPPPRPASPASRILTLFCWPIILQVIISAEMGSRTGKQCRERWHNHLDPTSELISFERQGILRN